MRTKGKWINKNGINSLSYRMEYAMLQRGMIGADITRKAEEYGIRLGSSTISQYLSGKYTPKQDKIVILSKILGVPEMWLMGLTPLEDMTGNSLRDYTNPAEAELIGLYRKLNKDGREFLMKLAHTIADTKDYRND